MKDSRTPKIVVGVSLVALYAAGLTFLTLRDENAIARRAPSAVSAQTVAAPASAIPESAGTLASANAPAPEASAPAIAPASIAPGITDSAKTPETTRPPAASKPKPRVEDVPVASLPSPRPPVTNDAEASRSNSGSNAVSELTPAAGSVASESVTSAEDKPAGQNGQSTTETAPATIDN